MSSFGWHFKLSSPLPIEIDTDRLSTVVPPGKKRNFDELRREKKKRKENEGEASEKAQAFSNKILRRGELI